MNLFIFSTLVWQDIWESSRTWVLPGHAGLSLQDSVTGMPQAVWDPPLTPKGQSPWDPRDGSIQQSPFWTVLSAD